MAIDHSRFDVAGYDAFRQRAGDPSLSGEEKIGFPASLREGAEGPIADDIAAKLGWSGVGEARVLDVGCGCGALAREIAARATARGDRLVLVDSPEMLAALDPPQGIAAVPGRFPENLDAIRAACDAFDMIIVYSVAQYVHKEGNLSAFAESAAALLDHGGRLLIGDIPNASMRARFLSSPAGLAHHRAHYDPEGAPRVPTTDEIAREINDATLLMLATVLRARGYHAYLLPQDARLPQANRREDLLVVKP
jgi:SAM-dependent methyltransferase